MHITPIRNRIKNTTQKRQKQEKYPAMSNVCPSLSDKTIEAIFVYLKILLAFIDNYFDMLPNTEYSVSVKTTMSAKELSEKLKFRDLSMK